MSEIEKTLALGTLHAVVTFYPCPAEENYPAEVPLSLKAYVNVTILDVVTLRGLRIFQLRETGELILTLNAENFRIRQDGPIFKTGAEDGWPMTLKKWFREEVFRLWREVTATCPI